MISEDNLCGFLDGADSFGDFLQLNGILVNMVDMPATVQGFTYLSLKEEYHIVINENLSLGTKQKIFLHELKHIIKDLHEIDTIVGLDYQYNNFEVEADIFARNLLNEMKNLINDERGHAIIG